MYEKSKQPSHTSSSFYFNYAKTNNTIKQSAINI